MEQKEGNKPVDVGNLIQLCDIDRDDPCLSIEERLRYAASRHIVFVGTYQEADELRRLLGLGDRKPYPDRIRLACGTLIFPSSPLIRRVDVSPLQSAPAIQLDMAKLAEMAVARARVVSKDDPRFPEEFQCFREFVRHSVHADPETCKALRVEGLAILKRTIARAIVFGDGPFKGYMNQLRRPPLITDDFILECYPFQHLYSDPTLPLSFKHTAIGGIYEIWCRLEILGN